MQLVTETQSDDQKILIIDRAFSFILKDLKRVLTKYQNNVFVSPKLQTDLHKFKVVYIVNGSFSHIRKLLLGPINTRLIFIFNNNKKGAEQCAKYIERFYPTQKN